MILASCRLIYFSFENGVLIGRKVELLVSASYGRKRRRVLVQFDWRRPDQTPWVLAQVFVAELQSLLAERQNGRRGSARHR